jgi:GAF domain-containing protein
MKKVEWADADNHTDAAGGLGDLADLVRDQDGFDILLLQITEPYASRLRGLELNPSASAITLYRSVPGAGEVHTAIDRLVDPRSAEQLGFAFYAGLPVRLPSDQQVGTVVVLGREARASAEDVLATLCAFRDRISAAVARELDKHVPRCEPGRLSQG